MYENVVFLVQGFSYLWSHNSDARCAAWIPPSLLRGLDFWVTDITKLFSGFGFINYHQTIMIGHGKHRLGPGQSYLLMWCA
jgi:hypothetical protein